MASHKIRILHTADLHLGTNFSSFPDREVRDILRGEQSNILLELTRVVKAEKIDLVLIAGDLFDRPDLDQQIVNRVKNNLANLDCKVHICAGNHDPYIEGSFWATEWPDNVHIVPHTEVESYYYEDLGILVDSVSFSDIYSINSLFTAAPQTDVPVDTLKLLMLHGDFGIEDRKSSYNPIPISSVKAQGYDYLALGHIHLAQEGNLGFRDAQYAYPGAPQGRGFDELGQGHFLVGTFTRDSGLGRYNQEWKKHILNTRPFLIHEINISDVENEHEIQQAIEEDLIQWQKTKEFDLKRAILRLVLVGSPDLKFNISLGHLQEYIKSLDYFYVEIEDKTKVPLELDRWSKHSGFGQILVQEYEAQKEKALPEEKERVDRALDLILRAHERTINET